ncbi:MAG: hypothetical protein WCK88_03330 [bacterium]
MLTTTTVDTNIDRPTVLYVSGADLYIKGNIKYNTTSSGKNPSLVIIVQKDTQGI